jgi:hypothetical protein
VTTCDLCRLDNTAIPELPTCQRCYDDIAAALAGLSELLAALKAATPRTLARPARETPGTKTGPSSPANEELIDLRAELSSTANEWAARLAPHSNQAPIRTLTRHLATALAMTGGKGYAAQLLHLTELSRHRLDPPEVVHVRNRCPTCGTRGLVRYDNGSPAWCTYCHAKSHLAA